LWNHHNPIKEKETFERRITRFLEFLRNPDDCLLLYITKITNYNLINYKFCIILPVYDNKISDCFLYKTINWNLLFKNLKSYYNLTS
jgi:hypothetical protein